VEVSGELSNHDILSRIGQLHAVVLDQRADPATPPVLASAAPRRRQRRLPPAQVAELTTAYESGAAINDLAKRFGIHRSTVLEHLNRSETRGQRYPALDEHEVDVAMQLYGTGLSLRNVGIALGVHASTVRLSLRRAGVTLRQRNGWNR
jgi:DNA-directed RNA polymerase specialized sigma24 family protein